MGKFDHLMESSFEDELPDKVSLKDMHSVIVHFTYYKDDLDELYDLEDKLEMAIKDGGVGEYDGHEIATDLSDGFLFMYGANAETLFKAVKPILEETDFTKGATASLRFGGHDREASEIEIEIDR